MELPWSQFTDVTVGVSNDANSTDPANDKGLGSTGTYFKRSPWQYGTPDTTNGGKVDRTVEYSDVNNYT